MPHSFLWTWNHVVPWRIGFEERERDSIFIWQFCSWAGSLLLWMCWLEWKYCWCAFSSSFFSICLSIFRFIIEGFIAHKAFENSKSLLKEIVSESVGFFFFKRLSAMKLKRKEIVQALTTVHGASTEQIFQKTFYFLFSLNKCQLSQILSSFFQRL